MLAEALGRASERSFAPAPAADVAGGGLHRCARWETRRGPAFVKFAPAAEAGLLDAEAAGLRELAATRALRVPEVLAVAVVGGQAALALEWLEFGPSTLRSEALLGGQLAALHRTCGARFGWHRDNAIGRTPQSNSPSDDWVNFYATQRLGYQLQLAGRNGLAVRTLDRGRRLVERCASFFTAYRPAPSLLHGDLWGGNWATERASSAPVLFDPAVYYGDREADLAMTRLFGGFGSAFYAAYHESWPLDPGAGTRRTLYDLYHVLNHYNLCGGAYGAQAAALVDRLLAET